MTKRANEQSRAEIITSVDWDISAKKVMAHEFSATSQSAYYELGRPNLCSPLRNMYQQEDSLV